jgi:hypothetical protein
MQFTFEIYRAGQRKSTGTDPNLRQELQELGYSNLTMLFAAGYELHVCNEITRSRETFTDVDLFEEFWSQMELACSLRREAQNPPDVSCDVWLPTAPLIVDACLPESAWAAINARRLLEEEGKVLTNPAPDTAVTGASGGACVTAKEPLLMKKHSATATATQKTTAKASKHPSSVQLAVNPQHHAGFVDDYGWLDVECRKPHFRTDPEGFIKAVRLQVDKYMGRNGRKDDELQEFKKAAFYLQYIIMFIENGRKPILAIDVHKRLGTD